MFDDHETKREYRKILNEQERIAESYRRWLDSWDRASLDKFAGLMDAKTKVRPQV